MIGTSWPSAYAPIWLKCIHRWRLASCWRLVFCSVVAMLLRGFAISGRVLVELDKLRRRPTMGQPAVGRSGAYRAVVSRHAIDPGHRRERARPGGGRPGCG